MHNPEDDGTRSGPLCQSASSVEHWLTGIVGLAVTAAVAVVLYQYVVAMAQQLEYLSSTALIFLFMGVWILVWAFLEVAWEYRAGRLFAS